MVNSELCVYLLCIPSLIDGIIRKIHPQCDKCQWVCQWVGQRFPLEKLRRRKMLSLAALIIPVWIVSSRSVYLFILLVIRKGDCGQSRRKLHHKVTKMSHSGLSFARVACCVSLVSEPPNIQSKCFSVRSRGILCIYLSMTSVDIGHLLETHTGSIVRLHFSDHRSMDPCFTRAHDMHRWH